MEEFELNNNHKQQEEQQEDQQRQEETDLGGTDEQPPKEQGTVLGGYDKADPLDNLDALISRGRKVVDPMEKIFGDRSYEAETFGLFIDNVMDLKKERKELQSPKFIKYLMDKKDMTIKRIVSVGSVNDYEISYLSHPIENDYGVTIIRNRDFKTNGGEIHDYDWGTVVEDLRYHYDKWRELERNKVMKRAGIVTAIGLSFIGLITGLSVGLTRKGTDMVHASKRKEEKAKKLTPAQEIIPWTEIEKASGKGLILIGDHIYLVIGGTILYLYTRRKHK